MNNIIKIASNSKQFRQILHNRHQIQVNRQQSKSSKRRTNGIDPPVGDKRGNGRSLAGAPFSGDGDEEEAGLDKRGPVEA